MTLDVLICTLNKGVVSIADLLLPPMPQIRYVVSFQYTDEKYLRLVPSVVLERSDVLFCKYYGKGLSANRNYALEHASSDLVLFADDDARFTAEAFMKIMAIFQANEHLDVAFFQAYSYIGRPLKEYSSKEKDYTSVRGSLGISAIEMVMRRKSVQGKIRFDERFGLGTQFLTCGEEEVWVEDARRLGLQMKYFPIKIVETSMLLKSNLVYVDAGVQRSKGAVLYYIYGYKAWWLGFCFAFHSAMKRLCHFVPVYRNIVEGINYIRSTPDHTI